MVVKKIEVINLNDLKNLIIEKNRNMFHFFRVSFEKQNDENIHNLRTNYRRFYFFIDIILEYYKNSSFIIKLFKIKRIFKKSGDLRNIQIQKIEFKNLNNLKYKNYIINCEKKYYNKLIKLLKKFLDKYSEEKFINDLLNLEIKNQSKFDKFILKKLIKIEKNLREKSIYLYNTNSLHNLRIELKKLRYILEAINDLYNFNIDLKKIKEGQEILGEIQDTFIKIKTIKKFDKEYAKKLKLILKNLKENYLKERMKYFLNLKELIEQTNKNIIGLKKN